MTETCHTSAGGWRLNRLHDSFRRPATCTLSSSVFLRVRGLVWNRGGAVGVVTAGRRRNHGSILGRSKRCARDPKLPERLWKLSSVLFSGYLGFSLGLMWPGRETGQLIHLVPRLGMTRAVIVSPSSMPSWREKDSFYFVLLIGFDTGTKSESFRLTKYFFILAGVRNP